MTENRTKRLLQRDSPALGLWFQSSSPLMIEAAGQQPIDWLLIDCEHGATPYEQSLPLLQALQSSQATPLVRIPSADGVAIKRVLDMGAQGLVIPQVESVEQVERVVAACRYPPAGTRGIGPYRASGYGAGFPAYYASSDAETLIVIQIETLAALESVEAIAELDGVDVLFVGPADLSAALGRFPDMRHEKVEAAVERILAAARKAGKAAGYYCTSGAEAKSRLDQGFRMVNVASDFGLLARGLRRELERARDDGGAGAE